MFSLTFEFKFNLITSKFLASVDFSPELPTLSANLIFYQHPNVTLRRMGTLSNGGLSKRPLENGNCASSSGLPLKYKKRRVSAVRDFPPGCGRNAPSLSSPDTKAESSLGAKENLLVDVTTVNVATGDCMKVSAIQDFPSGCGWNAARINPVPSQDTKAESSLGAKEHLLVDVKTVNVATGDCMKVSAIRDFPSGCGWNAAHINPVPSQDTKAESSLGAKENLVVTEKTVNVATGDCMKVSATWEFPSGCGQNAAHIDPVPSQDTKAESSLGGKENLVVDEKAMNVAMVDYTKVSATLNFPSGFGLNTACINPMPSQDTKAETSLVATGDCMKGFETGNGSLSRQAVKSPAMLELSDSLDELVGKVVASSGVKVELSPMVEPLGTDLPKTLESTAPQLSKESHGLEFPAVVRSEGALESKTVLEIGSMVDEMVPAGGAKVCSPPQWPISNVNTLGNSSLKSKYPKRRAVSAIRDFPPFCGRNAPRLTEEERLRIALGNKALSGPDKDAVPGNMNVQNGNSKEDDVEGSGTELKSKSKKTAVQGKPLMEKLTADVQGSPVREKKAIVEEVKGDLQETNAQKRKLEGSVPQRKNSQKVTGKGYEDVNDVAREVGKEIVLYPGDKSLKSKIASDRIAMGHVVNRVIVQGLMAAPNCPWRHGVSSVTGKEKSKSTSRAKVNEADCLRREVLKKKLVPPGMAAYKGKGPLVVKDEGDSATKGQDEDSSWGRRTRNVEVTLPPFGPNSSSDGDARNKVRGTLRLFQAICRKLLQEEEAKMRQKGDSAIRIDLLAAQIIREKGKEVNPEKCIIGAVPGVEVGDEFQYRVELALVGIHRLYQSGIDFTNHGGMKIATSVVASGGYADDLDNPDVLIYSGQGGNAVGKNKIPEDQKLERGNLALKNSISTRNPVRVVRGFKETKASKSEARAKVVPSYTYDGLYTVDKYRHDVGKHGKLVFMFELRRIPGQPELAWKEVKKSNKFKIREGLCVDDISGGKELFPICAVNTIDNEVPPTCSYITGMKYPDWYCPTPPKGCDCVGGCSDLKKCSCVVKNGGEIPYNHNGAIVEAKPLVYECGPSCKCPPSCHNRVSQHGIKIQLEIFKTESRGLGVRSLTFIPSGSFICEYVGELLEDKEAEQRYNDEYLFDIGKNLSDAGFEPDAENSPSEVAEDGGFTIDAAKFGNVGRFINHSCSPNLYAQNVLYDHEDEKIPHIMLFAAENIPPLQELTYHYNYSVDQIRDSSGNIKMKDCYCGSAECTGRMY